jgi:hypothetical protein
MKKLILALAALMVSLAAYGQGQFVFNNRIPPDINAKFSLDNGSVPGSDARHIPSSCSAGPVALLKPPGLNLEQPHSELAMLPVT